MEKKTQFTGPRRSAGGAPRPPRPAGASPAGQKPRRGGAERNSKDPYVINEHIRHEKCVWLAIMLSKVSIR